MSRGGFPALRRQRSEGLLELVLLRRQHGALLLSKDLAARMLPHSFMLWAILKASIGHCFEVLFLTLRSTPGCAEGQIRFEGASSVDA